MTNLTDLSLYDLSARMVAGGVTASDYLDQCIAAVDEKNPAINAVVASDLERAKALATESDERRQRGAALSPLDGVPIAVKANILIDGFADHAGIKGRRDSKAPNDAHAVTKLRSAGMIPCFQANMDEGALGITGRNAYFGDTIHPLNAAFSPGGSSSGSAAVISANMLPAALGSDSLGSIRIPAALTGTVGLKPTKNLINTVGTIPLSWTFDHVGPMARTVSDAFMLFSALLGIPASPDKLPNDIKGMRVGVPYEFIEACPALSDDVFKAFEKSVSKLKDLGAVIVPASIRNYQIDAARLAAFQICEIETAEFHGAMLNENPDAFSTEFAEMLRWGMHAGDKVKLKALTTVAAAGDAFDEALMGLDAMIMPTVPVSAFAAGELAPKGMYDYTAPANFAGVPAISVPMDQSDDTNMPAGLQIVGNALEERKLFTIGKLFGVGR
jgi:aspartyl-tRNA(Asn)/glutamyl-tRNA(Gln) amidotransferase subunit A